MAGTFISALPAAPSAQLTDVFPVDQLPGPITYKETNAQLLSLFQANGTALTAVSDTNVTMTLGGSPSIALLNPASMTLGWTGTLSPSRGGTGVNNGTSTLTLGGNLTTVGAFSSTFTMTNTTNVTFPTSGTLATVGGSVTSVSGTANRITSTGGTTPVIDISAAYVGQTSITTLGTIATGVWQGTVIGATYGGTGVNNGASTITLGGSLTTSGAFASTFTMTGTTNVTFPTSGTLSTTTGTVTSVSGTANRITSTGGTTPVIDISASYVGQSSITTLGTITTGVWTGTTIAVANGGTGITTTPSNGQVPIGNGTNYTAATLTAGSGITITNASGSITIASSTEGLTWTTVSGTSQSAAVNNGYITNNAGLVTVTLPTTFAIGDTVEILGLGAGGWKLSAGTATTIRMGSSVTSSAGSLSSANQYDTIKVVGLVANTTWSVQYALSAGLTVA